MSKSKANKLRRRGSKYVKTQLIEQYGHYCHLCRRYVEGGRSNIQMHHIKRIAENGLTSLENGSLLCDKCHKYVHSFDGKEYYIVLANKIKFNKVAMLYKNLKKMGK